MEAKVKYIAKYGGESEGCIADREFDTIEEARAFIRGVMNGIRSDGTQVSPEYLGYWNNVGMEMSIVKATTTYEEIEDAEDVMYS